MKRLPSIALILTLSAAPFALADDDLTRDAAIGGAVGGALGGVVGAELGGREGAIVGSGVGAAIGTGVSTDGYREHRVRYEPDYRERGHYHQRDYRSYGGHPHGRFCPPGQAKKGRC